MAVVVPQGSLIVKCHCQTTPALKLKVVVVVVVDENVEA
jgi:hypothetical protein